VRKLVVDLIGKCDGEVYSEFGWDWEVIGEWNGGYVPGRVLKFGGCGAENSERYLIACVV
jgi:hypothetical protein